MNARTIVVLALKLAALTALLFVCFAVASAVVLPPTPAEPDNQGVLTFLAVCFLMAAPLAYVILRARWSGWRLAVVVAFVLYGVMTFMPQIETAVFVTTLPPGFLPRLFLMGALVAGVYAPLAVLVLGKWRQEGDEPSTLPPALPASEWAWRLAVIAVVYVALYFTFGYYLAWRNPAVAEYYGGVDPGSFVAQLGAVMRDTPWLPAFQALRAMMWAAIAAPVVRMTKGRWWEGALAVALLFSVVMNAQILLPNPYMPEAVRMAHLVETASSNFIFGWIVAWLLRPLRAARS